jgi:hypothetical protein
VRRGWPKYRGRFAEDDDSDRVVVPYVVGVVPLMGIALALGLPESSVRTWSRYLLLLLLAVFGGKYVRLARARRREERQRLAEALAGQTDAIAPRAVAIPAPATQGPPVSARDVDTAPGYAFVIVVLVATIVVSFAFLQDIVAWFVALVGTFLATWYVADAGRSRAIRRRSAKSEEPRSVAPAPAPALTDRGGPPGTVGRATPPSSRSSSGPSSSTGRASGRSGA